MLKLWELIMLAFFHTLLRTCPYYSVWDVAAPEGVVILSLPSDFFTLRLIYVHHMYLSAFFPLVVFCLRIFSIRPISSSFTKVTLALVVVFKWIPFPQYISFFLIYK